MAKLRTTGIDDLILSMKELGELSGEVADEMLLRAAEELKKAWREAIVRHGLVNTGGLRDSVGYESIKQEGDVKRIDVLPLGKSTQMKNQKTGKTYKRKKAVRFAEIAFINHYGTSSRPATHFVDTAEELAKGKVEQVMNEIWTETLKKKGLI